MKFLLTLLLSFILHLGFSQVREFKCDKIYSMDNLITIGDDTGYRMYTIVSKVNAPTENIYQTLEDGRR